MASRLCDTAPLIAGIEESTRRGDWLNAGALTTLLKQMPVPENRDELGEYLRCLEQALIAAKTSRAHSAATLMRLNAAARFHCMSAEFSPHRQKFAETTDS